MNETAEIINLLEWKGGWAMRALFDDAVRRFLSNKEQDFKLAKQVATNSTGISAVQYFDKYKKLTGLKSNIQISKLLTKDISQIFNLEKIVNIPYELTADYWLGKLCDHLETNRRNLTPKIEQTLAKEVFLKGKPKELFQSWSFPIISNFFSLSFQENAFEYVENEIGNLCWKRWYLTEDQKPLLIETEKYSNLKSSQWLIWRLLHDATHILHLHNFAEAGSYLNPNWLLTMEAAAMYSEREFLRLIDNMAEIPAPQNYELNLFNIKTLLLIGFVERALRLDYDLAIHTRRQSVENWLLQTKRKTGIYLNIYGFAKEFHGLPSFCASYMLGLKAFETEKDKLSILKGKKKLDFLVIENKDSLSNSVLTDIPIKLSHHSIDIQSVGTTDTVCFFKLLHPFTQKYIDVEAKASLTVDLDFSRRGIHMSRLQQVLNSLLEEKWKKMEDVSKFAAEKAKVLQDSKTAEASFQLNSYVDTYNVKSKSQSRQPITITAETNLTENKCINTVGISIKVMTACPCTLEYSKLKTEEVLTNYFKSEFDNTLMEKMPATFTHSQRGILTVKVTSEKELISVKNLYYRVSQVAHLVESVLKRPDEHFLVQKSHGKPQFCEDLCREVAVAIASELNFDDYLEVIAELDESIHPHKAIAKLKIKAQEVWC